VKITVADYPNTQYGEEREAKTGSTGSGLGQWVWDAIKSTGFSAVLGIYCEIYDSDREKAGGDGEVRATSKLWVERRGAVTPRIRGNGIEEPKRKGKGGDIIKGLRRGEKVGGCCPL